MELIEEMKKYSGILTESLVAEEPVATSKRKPLAKKKTVAPDPSKKYGKLARAIVTMAKEYIAYGVEDEDDQDMIEMYTSDGKDFVHIAQLLMAGKVKAAQKLYSGLDTAARDEVTIVINNVMPSLWKIWGYNDEY